MHKTVILFSCYFLAVMGRPAEDDALAATCKCGEGYQARTNTAHETNCEGILLDHVMPCNIPSPPKCECSGEISGILKDKDGTWCLATSNGKRDKSPCENKEEWDDFNVKYDQYLKSVKDELPSNNR